MTGTRWIAFSFSARFCSAPAHNTPAPLHDRRPHAFTFFPPVCCRDLKVARVTQGDRGFDVTCTDVFYFVLCVCFPLRTAGDPSLMGFPSRRAELQVRLRFRFIPSCFHIKHERRRILSTPAGILHFYYSQ